MNNDKPDRKTTLYIGIIYYTLLAAYLLASLWPEQRLWGLNLLAYHSFWFKATLLAISALLPPVLLWQSSQRAQPGNTTGEKEYYLLTVVAFSLASLFCFVFFHTRTHFLGDGYTLLGSLIGNQAVFVKARNYGESVLHVWVYDLLNNTPEKNALLSYQIISIVAGSIFLAIAAVISSLLAHQKRSRILLFSGLISSGYLLLYFGYVENYALFLTSVFIYCAIGLLTLKQPKTRWIVLIPQGLMIFFHIFGLLFLPATLILLLSPTGIAKRAARWKTKTKLLIVSAVGVAAFISLQILAASNLTLELALVPLTQTRFTVEQYTLFSLPHLLDFANLLLLLLPALPILLLLLYRNRTAVLPEKVGTAWMLAASLIPIAAIFLLDPKLGMPRDWDLFAFAGVPLTLFLFYTLLSMKHPTRTLKLGLVLSVSLGFVMLTARVAALNSESIGVSHFKNYLYLDKIKNRNAWVTLNNFYMDHADSTSAIIASSQRDSLFPEIALLDTYLLLYQKQDARSAEAGAKGIISMDPLYSDAYSLLGLTLANRGQNDSAIYYLNVACTMNPYRPDYHNQLAMGYQYQGNLDLAKEHFFRSLELDSSNFQTPYRLAQLYKNELSVEEYEFYLTMAAYKSNAPPMILKELAEYYVWSDQFNLATQLISESIELRRDTAFIEMLVKSYPAFDP
ncbi:MAG: hypothetical protein P1R58_03520 [bacterium]|nr:hypothetical protein [bacterium]